MNTAVGADTTGIPAVTITYADAPSDAQLTMLLTHEIAPAGKAARIPAILKARGYVLQFSALEAGQATVSWYFAQKGPHTAKPKSVLVATGSAQFASPAIMPIKLKLTAVGRKLLRSSKHVKLAGKDMFTPVGGTASGAVKVFTLRR